MDGEINTEGVGGKEWTLILILLFFLLVVVSFQLGEGGKGQREGVWG
jgi:cbb3-type cytochrome oxidase subunit 3